MKAISTYGTQRINAYEIIEDTLNLKDVRIFDYVYDADGRKTAVLNKKETAIAQSKQELIKDAFAEWIWKDPDRREAICKTYNILFNSNRPREYDGSHINFSGMNPEITLRKHQVNAIAHILYGGNTLLAHVVGAGKTFEMVAAAMESKRLGLCQKSLFVVPNHLTEQWATEFLQLYYEVAGAEPCSVIVLKQPFGDIPAGKKLLWVCGDRGFHCAAGVFGGELKCSGRLRVIPVEAVLNGTDDPRMKGLDFDSPAPSENAYMKRYSVANYAHRMRAGLAR